MFSYLPLKNNSVNIGLSFLLQSILAIIPSSAIDILRFYMGCILQYFYKYHPYHLSIK